MDDNKNDLGGLQIPSPSGQDTGGSASISASSASQETIRQRKERSDKGKPRGTRQAEPIASVPTISQSQFAALYDKDLWGKILASPGDAMAAITGKSHWEISSKERETLGATGSVAAQCFATSDPRYLALSLAIIALIDVYGVRIAKDMSDEKKRKAEEKRRRENVFGGEQKQNTVQ